MHFQKALVTVMNYQGVSIQELATRTGSDLRWILSITVSGKMFLPEYGRDVFLSYGNDVFHKHGNDVFLVYGKQFFQ